MKRRSYLGTLAAVTLAGCTGSRAGSPATTSDDGTGFRYELANVQTDDPPGENVTIGVTVTEQFSVDQPARLEIAFTNDADQARTFTFGSLVPWDTILAENRDGSGTLLLAPTDSVVPDETTDDCWQATDGVALPAVMREEELDPDETVTADFHVLAAHDSESCHSPGTYRFADENYLDEGWGFEIQVAET